MLGRLCPIAVNNLLRLLLVAAIVVTLRDPAFAQTDGRAGGPGGSGPGGGGQAGTGPAGATPGLFGRDIRTNARTLLDLSASVTEGYDSDVPRQFRSTIDPTNVQGGGMTTLFNAGAYYAWRRNKTQVGANASSFLRHYAELGQLRSVGHSAGLGMTTQTLGTTMLSLNQSAAYSPTYLYSLFPGNADVRPGDPGTTAPDYLVSNSNSYVYTSTLALAHRVGRRGTVTATGAYEYTDRLKETPTWKDISSYNLRGQFSRNATRNTAFSVTGSYRSGEFGYGGNGLTTEVGVDVGADFAKALSASRRATLGVRIGVTSADYPGNDLGIGFVRQYRGAGQATLTYPFTHTWGVIAYAKRGMEYIAALPTPVFADAVSVSVNGLVTRRMDVTASAAYSSGESLLKRDGLIYDTYTGDLRFRYAVSRTWAIYGEYLYYYYDFRGSIQLLAGMPSGLERSGARAGVMLWMPALRR